MGPVILFGSVLPSVVELCKECFDGIGNVCFNRMGLDDRDSLIYVNSGAFGFEIL